MRNKHLDMIGDTLKMLADKIYEETGEKMLIGWGVDEGETTTEGCVTSDGMNYPTACKLLVGITWFATEWYGNLPEDEVRGLDDL
jgi:hypothetical protein